VVANYSQNDSLMPQRLTMLFPVLAIAASFLAWLQPHWFNQLGGYIVPILMLIMFAMGMTLTIGDFQRVVSRRMTIAFAIALQFGLMPLIAYLLSRLFGFNDELLIGMVLVGSASGGTASNVICYLARADVALSVSMTLVSTLVAVVALPALSWLYLGQMVPVPVGSIFISVMKIVLLPLGAGLIINHYAANAVQRVATSLPFVTTAAIVFVIAIIVALNQESLATLSAVLVLAVMLHNVIGLSFSYGAARFTGQDESTCRTIAIEIGMQNSGLAVALAVKYFTPLAALPGALFSIWHNVTGSVLAAFWNREKT